MGRQRHFNKVNLFTGIIFNERIDPAGLILELESQFSRADHVSEIFDFNFTDYYNSEMGESLSRRFISFSDLISPEELPGIKILTNEIEIKYAVSGKRTVNLDPGYISDANVIIATTKNYYQRVPLTDGIYAQMEYVIKGKSLHALEWTYPDFRTDKYMNFFQDMLGLYKKKVAACRV